MTPESLVAAGGLPRRLCFYNAGFARAPRLRRILALAGHDLRLGLPGPDDGVVVWGRSRYAARGEAIAARRGVPLIRLEDAFLRSLRPGRMGDAPLGLLIDGQGVHYDAATPSTLETLLASHPLDDPALLARAATGIARLQHLHLSKYNLHDPALPAPAPGYVLVVDQTQGDASIRYGGASAATFAAMLAAARAENPGSPMLIKSHPETRLGLRPGHFTAEDGTLLAAPLSPWALLAGASVVYTVSSQLGFEAILAGHRPRVFGQPFYAGWGLSTDRAPHPRRQRLLTRFQLFAAAMILAPIWYDPCRDRLASFEEIVDQFEAETRAWREDHAGHIATGMRLWKRGRLQAVFGREKRLIFCEPPARALARAEATGRDLLIWAGKDPGGLAAPATRIRRVEDGFVRSRGLGANLVPPLSLVADDLGIYYDPGRESRLERLIAAPAPPGAAARANALIAQLVASGLTKYTPVGSALPDLPPGHRILVPGQVEDDASIRLGALGVSTNLGLLQATRAANPQAVLVYKPHPDVEAGLRPGHLPAERLRGLADVVATHADPAALIEACCEVWTMTSLLGFEALIRGKPVTCLGAPFYAGWGLTTDLGAVPARRKRLIGPGQTQPTAAPPQVGLPPHDPHGIGAAPGAPDELLLHLVQAALIAYPRYYDPVSRRTCPPEVAAERLASGAIPPTGPWTRALAKLQGRLATHARLWR